MRVLLFQPHAGPDHFRGVAAELKQLGLDPVHDLRPPSTHRSAPRLPEGIAAIAVTETLSPDSRHVLRMARDQGLPSLLIMDGVTDWRNTFVNPHVDSGFLRPAPVTRIACLGPIDEAVLNALGNTAHATGLPRLDSLRQLPAPSEPRLLVATARQPYFNAEERLALLDQLRDMRDVAHARGVPVRWRLGGGLDAHLCVSNDERPLAELLSLVSAVVTTPSTLAIESMASGRPTALLHAFDTPLWLTAPWIAGHAGEDRRGREATAAARATVTACGVESRSIDHRELFEHSSFVGTESTPCDRHRSFLRCLRTEDGAPRVAQLVASMIRLGDEAARHAPASLSRKPAPVPRRSKRTRVVSCVVADGTVVGGVTTWSERLSRSLNESDHGYDLRTLVISANPLRHGSPVSLDDPSSSLAVLDPAMEAKDVIAHVRESIERLEPELTLPNYRSFVYAACSQLRARGIPMIAVAHTNDAGYRRLISAYDDWDAAVAVSRDCETWLRPLAGDRPLERIVYGVPVAAAPRVPRLHGPLVIAYVGRLARVQKRIDRLSTLARLLTEASVPFELHVLGDGPDGSVLYDELRASGATFRWHGPCSQEQVQQFLPTVDVSVLVSDTEGASLSMLEAMGHGVVPCVMDFSGARDWIDDGSSGLIVPVGDVPAMAGRLGTLAADRAQLHTLGQQAWRSVRDSVGLEQMAAEYASLFDRCRSDHRRIQRSDSGTTLLECTGFVEAWTHDEATCDHWTINRLKEAGFERIAIDRPDADSDAVVITECPTPDCVDRAEAWRRRGLGVAFSPPAPAEWSRMASRCQEAVTDGCRNIAIYGAGRHTRRNGKLFSLGLPIVAVIDDSCDDATLFDVPVIRSGDAIDHKIDAVVLSSDVWEHELWKASEPLRRAGIRVLSVYGAGATAGSLTG